MPEAAWWGCGPAGGEGLSLGCWVCREISGCLRRQLLLWPDNFRGPWAVQEDSKALREMKQDRSW